MCKLASTSYSPTGMQGQGSACMITPRMEIQRTNIFNTIVVPTGNNIRAQKITCRRREMFTKTRQWTPSLARTIPPTLPLPVSSRSALILPYHLRLDLPCLLPSYSQLKIRMHRIFPKRATCFANAIILH